ncbi:hypothetical protein LTR62_000540 [Meristemomyces frigidus]|uniref:Uncharacterized protein n=1 Tax=Meristemomyces frigidus TaxID=1508187 RepID=A0AAN7TA35_9PEZI|nr:hypothetical protein LTR62_000540 [Meristemomyces frigidus]
MPPSIWDYTSRVRFEDDVLALHALASSQRVASQRPAARPCAALEHDTSYVLEPGTERQLSRDFAFLAAWQASPDCVSAATIQEEEGSDLIVYVAANGSVPEPVRSSLQRLSEVLRQRAARCVTREICIEQCVLEIASLHKERILQRLGCSARSASMTKQHGQNVLLSGRLQLMIDQLAVRPSTKASADRNATVILLQRLLSAIRICGTLAPECDAPQILEVIKLSYELSVDGVSVASRLRKLGFDEVALQRKEIRHIQAIANYHRISMYLTEAARTYRTLFKRIQVKPIPHYKCERWRGLKHYVHAEIQLLVHHEHDSAVKRPRFIGTSKRACFLCYTFMTAHGRYAVTDSHGEIHPQWTVPDQVDCTLKMREILGVALRQSATSVRQALARSRAQKKKTGPEVQSMIDLVLDKLRTPSQSTVADSHVGSCLISRSALSVSTTVRADLPSQDIIPSQNDSTTDISLHEEPVVLGTTEYHELHAGDCIAIHQRNLIVYLELEAGGLASTVSCVKRTTGTTTGETFNVASMPPGEEIVVDTPELDGRV